MSPMHWAAFKAYRDIIEQLIRAGADVNTVDKVRNHIYINQSLYIVFIFLS